MRINLYQIIPELDTNHLLYTNLEYIRKSCRDKFPAEIYELVYSGEVDANSYEDVWAIFNTNFPNSYKGRSMSVSDVMEVIDLEHQSKFIFCDSVGFQEIDFEKSNVMTLVLNHNFDCAQEKRENVSIFFISKSGLKQINCKEFALMRCKYSETQLGYRISCKDKDGNEKKFEFVDCPSIIVSKCFKNFPQELLYIDDKKLRYGTHSKENLGIVCTWLIRNGYEFESLYGGYS